MGTGARIVALAGLGAVLLGSGPSQAGLLSYLTGEQQQEAIAHGKTTYERLRAEAKPVDDLEPEYLAAGPDNAHAILYTEFGALAMEARRWLAINRELKPADVEHFLRQHTGRLHFSVTLDGPSRDFLFQYKAQLVQGDRSRELVSWSIYRGERKPGSTPARFTAVGRYVFASHALQPDAPIALVLTAPGGAQVRFEFDLSTLR